MPNSHCIVEGEEKLQSRSMEMNWDFQEIKLHIGML